MAQKITKPSKISALLTSFHTILHETKKQPAQKEQIITAAAQAITNNEQHNTQSDYLFLGL
jgi:hypothetical protein